MLFCMVVVFTSLKINMYEFVNGHYVTFHFKTQRPTIACTCSSLFAIETNNNNNFEENERKKNCTLTYKTNPSLSTVNVIEFEFELSCILLIANQIEVNQELHFVLNTCCIRYGTILLLLLLSYWRWSNEKREKKMIRKKIQQNWLPFKNFNQKYCFAVSDSGRQKQCLDCMILFETFFPFV